MFTYNHRNRLSAVNKGTVTSEKVKGKWVDVTVSTQTNYEYNALGQRVIKSSDSADIYYLFNLQGQLIAEADSLGTIQVEYVYLDGQPLAQISTNEITTEGTFNLTLDNTASSTTGSWTLKSNRKALNSDYLLASGGTNSTATWQPTLAAGSYTVYARWISNRSNSTQVPYTISHNGQTDTVYVDQTTNNATWVQLGTFDFDGGGLESIQVSDSNGQTAVDGIQLVEQSVTQLETQLQYIHNDHLGTPQRMTNSSGDVVWEALYEPFGAAIVNEDVDGDGQSVALNLRFPGQYFDVETGLHYNYFRDYDPSTGRYVQSDPIGLSGGLNTYGYVYQNPLIYSDPFGLYGTNSCEYYSQACDATGDLYPCRVAKSACPTFPKGDGSDGRSKKAGNWMQCVRQCLQEKHKEREQTAAACPIDDIFDSYDNPVSDHSYCFARCKLNPENPHAPFSDKELPDADPQW